MRKMPFSSYCKKILASGLVGAALMTAIWAGPLWAQQGSRARILYSPPLTVQAGDTAQVWFTNVGQRPVRVRIFFLRADNSSMLQESELLLTAPDDGAFEDITLSVGLGIIAAVLVEGRSQVRVSLQVTDAAGQTKIFTDGFESGDTSR